MSAIVQPKKFAETAVPGFKQTSLLRKIVYSGISGAIATTSIYPIDIVKTKLQNQVKAGAGTTAAVAQVTATASSVAANAARTTATAAADNIGAATAAAAAATTYSSPLDCFRKIITAEGGIGLYRGWPPAVLLVMPEKALKLTLNDLFTEMLQARQPGAPLPVYMEAVAGGMAGFCQVIVTNPMELLKIQGVLLNERFARGEIDSLAYGPLLRRLGVAGLYTGVAATLIRDVPFSLMYFAGYAVGKRFLTRDSNAHIGIKGFCAGTVSGTIAAAITNPMDVVKTRVHANADPTSMSLPTWLRNERRLLVDTTRSILQTEGAGVLVNGIVPRCAIIAPLFGITMSCFELFKTTFG